MEDVNVKEGGVGYCDPNVTFYHRIKALFEDDPDFEIGAIKQTTLFGSSNKIYEFTVTVHDRIKCDLFTNLVKLPSNCTRLKINVKYEGKSGFPAEAYAYLLSTNPHFSRLLKTDDDDGLKMDCLLMEPEAIQYNNDVFSNPWKMETITAEKLAKAVFHESHQNFTSDIL